jgi:hypothetical protein
MEWQWVGQGVVEEVDEEGEEQDGEEQERDDG